MGNEKKNNKKLPQTKPKERKSILKNSSTGISQEKLSDSSSPEAKKSIKWDEMNVIATLHPVGKDYGHMKIDEAPTPYERHNKGGVDANDLARKLEEIKKTGRKSQTSTSPSTDSDSFSAEQSRRESFNKKRKDHYQEFTIAKQFSKQHDLDDEEED